MPQDFLGVHFQLGVRIIAKTSGTVRFRGRGPDDYSLRAYLQPIRAPTRSSHHTFSIHILLGLPWQHKQPFPAFHGDRVADYGAFHCRARILLRSLLPALDPALQVTQGRANHVVEFCIGSRRATETPPGPSVLQRHPPGPQVVP